MQDVTRACTSWNTWNEQGEQKDYSHGHSTYIKNRGSHFDYGHLLAQISQSWLLELTGPYLFLCGLRGEDFVQFKGHGLALIGQEEEGVIVPVKGHHVLRVHCFHLALAYGTHPAEHPDVS